MPLNNKLNKYQQNRVIAATGPALARIALDESIKSVRAAIGQLRAGDPMERSRHVSRAMSLLTEFGGMLNDSENPSLVRNIKSVIAFAHDRLIEAHAQQSEARMNEAIDVLKPILEAWTVAEQRSVRTA
jgi:flagellar biosynthetic protein FliS